MEDCGISFTLLKKSVAKVIFGVGKIRAHFQRFPVMSNRFVNLAFLRKNDAQIIMSHPATRVSGNRGPPERFNVSVHRALAPGEHGKRRNNTNCRAEDEMTTLFERSSQSCDTGGRKRDWTDAGQVLIMVRHKGVAKCVEHDETDYRAERRYKK